ncbi:hypothetical protein [Persicobacter diffluens]|uniref:Toxin-antitoxin system YwqK family antitoxin n=1 Tax=Persicobacter diffluens TaxID=981 RepID=A0AAN5AKR8_9BACT|nr:hypothetical protein PEDI_26490 [Persicobacter diffluens]
MMLKPFATSLFVMLTLLSLKPEQSLAQSEDFNLANYQPVTLTLNREEVPEVEETKVKKKKKKNVFYGIKTKKGFTRKGFGNDAVIEQFHYIKEPMPEKVSQYIPDLFWIDFRTGKVKNSRKINWEYGRLLHGPYKLVKGDQVLEQGIFYYGVKQGRWVKLDSKDILQDKKKYFHGWLKESKVAYYDSARTKVKEVIPVSYGKVEGTYYRFFENGNLAVRGDYSEGRKIGKWTEYYSVGNRRKRVIVYPKNPYDKKFIPFMEKEWDKRGRTIYDAAKRKT